MKNLLKIIGIAAIIAGLGFTMITCSEEEKVVKTVETGKLTITGFNYVDNGKFVGASATTAGGTYLFTKNEAFSTVANQMVTLIIWEHKGGTPTLYAGSDTSVKFEVSIFEDEPEDPFNDAADDTKEVTATFVKGLAITALPPCVHVDEDDDIASGSPDGICDICGKPMPAP